ncbi:MAG: hypothetical protein WAU34_12830, partial [Desulfobacterales bacterium]
MDSQLPHRAFPRDFLYILFKRKLQILIFFLATICMVTIGTFLADYKDPEISAFYEEQSRMLKNQLTGSEKRLEDFRKTHDLSSLEEQRNRLLAEHSKRRTDLNQTESQIVETRSRLEQLRLQLAKVPRNIPQSETIDHNPLTINSSEASLVALELKEKELLNEYTEQGRLVQNVKDEIAMVR